MNPTTFMMRNPIRKGEDLRKFIIRVITENCDSDLPGAREEKIGEALQFYRTRIVEHVEQEEQDRAVADRRHLEARLVDLTAKYDALEAQHARLKSTIPTSISIREAEEARLGAFKLAREKAALLLEKPGGEPTAGSEAIRAIADIKPKWSK
ncbi:hypothetical protein [Rhizobium leguminosarum]|uniref:hypothetical protein n=1 Tax=Rhizobium leguminosarum TaxID=384 RepID=UPI001C9853E8|nr:hypothetical protein [Rhizobium leguminosarum]MBY5585294.1 hypothetical protein [Rhizobium leguminosarum]